MRKLEQFVMYEYWVHAVLILFTLKVLISPSGGHRASKQELLERKSELIFLKNSAGGIVGGIEEGCFSHLKRA